MDTNTNGTWDEHEDVFYDANGDGLWNDFYRYAAAADVLLAGVRPLEGSDVPDQADEMRGAVLQPTTTGWTGLSYIDAPAGVADFDNRNDTIFVDANNDGQFNPGETVLAGSTPG